MFCHDDPQNNFQAELNFDAHTRTSADIYVHRTLQWTNKSAQDASLARHSSGTWKAAGSQALRAGVFQLTAKP